MVEYNQENVKLADSQLNKLKTAVKNQKWILKCLMEIIYLMIFLTTRQTTKSRIAFENNTSTKISKITQSGFLGSLLSKLAGPLMKVAVL